jgi:hypothetical protein
MYYYTHALQLNPSKATFAKPYNSAQGFHPGFFWVAFIVVAFISIRVYIAIIKDLRGGRKKRSNKKRL